MPYFMLMAQQGDRGGALVGVVPSLCGLLFAVLSIAALWMIFEKAGEEGWKSIIPIYNSIVLLQIVGRPVWWLLLFFIPVVNVVVAFLVMKDLAESFGKDIGFAIGLFLLPFIFLLILAFGDAQYQGPAAVAGGSMV